MKKVNKLLIGFLASLSLIIVLSGCVKDDYDDPPASSIPFDPNKVLTIEQVKQLYDTNNHYYKFTDIFSVFATVTMDDKSGNIYKSAFIQDSTGGIDLYLNSSGLYQGDSIRIMLQGAIVSDYNDLIQITNLDIEKNFEKIKTFVEVEPLLVTLKDIIDSSYKFQSKLIELEAVQFFDGELGKTFADAQDLKSENRILVDCDTNQVDVRTSGYADFANLVLPIGKGSMIAIASYYDGNVQLVIRNINELQLDSLRCDGTWGPIIFQGFDFDDGFGNWNPISLIGGQEWEFEPGYGKPKPCVKISGYSWQSNENDDWLISPALDLSSYSDLTLSFQTAKNYTGNDLEVMISTDYSGGDDPSTATWSILSATLSSGNNNWAWIDSGDVDISEYNESNVYIAFRYTSTNQESATWELDNIKISGNE